MRTVPLRPTARVPVHCIFTTHRCPKLPWPSQTPVAAAVQPSVRLMLMASRTADHLRPLAASPRALRLHDASPPMFLPALPDMRGDCRPAVNSRLTSMTKKDEARRRATAPSPCRPRLGKQPLTGKPPAQPGPCAAAIRPSTRPSADEVRIRASTARRRPTMRRPLSSLPLP